MPIKQIRVSLLIGFVAIHLNTVFSQSLLPTKAEQVNLLTNIKEVLEEIKNCSRLEHGSMFESVNNELGLTINRTVLLISTLEELTLLKLTSGSNSVCSIDAKDNVEVIRNKSIAKVAECYKDGVSSLGIKSEELTTVMDSAIQTGEDFIEKLNFCSLSKGLSLIACYKKIIQNDVMPARTIISKTIQDHQKTHEASYELKLLFNQCIDKSMKELRNELDAALNFGLTC